MARRLRSRPGLAAAVAALVAAALVGWWQSGSVYDYAKEPRDATTSSPTLSPLFSREVVLLRKGGRACLSPVTFYADTGKARIRLRAPKAPVPKVVLEMRAEGYVERGVVEGLEPQTEGSAIVDFFPRAGREVTGEFCFINLGPTPIQLIGTNEGRSLTPVGLEIDGRFKPDAELELVLFKAGRHSLASRRGEIVDRASTLTAGFVPAWLLWPIAVLMVLLPAIAVALFAASVLSSARGARAPDDPR